jgi:hypothetical protein
MRICPLVLSLCLASCGHSNLPGPEAVPLPTDFAGEWRVTILDTISHQPLLGGAVHWRMPDWKSDDARNFHRCSRCWVGTADLAVSPGAHARLPGTDLAAVEVDDGKAIVSFGMIPGAADDGHIFAEVVPAGAILEGRAFRAGYAVLPAGQLVLERMR